MDGAFTPNTTTTVRVDVFAGLRLRLFPVVTISIFVRLHLDMLLFITSEAQLKGSQ
jgi:hypothetical protein